jgi:cadmium resistance protein CadD (predicted permease)
MSVMLYYGQPLIAGIVPEKWVHAVTALIALILCSPFLWMLLKAGADSPDVDKLWQSGSRWRVRITACGMLRLIITAIFVSYFVDYAIPGSMILGVFAIVAIMFVIYFSSQLEKQGKGLTKNFTDNLSARERMNQHNNDQK